MRIKTNSFPYKLNSTNPKVDSTLLTFQRDNDAILLEDYLEIVVQTGDNGCIDHNYDFGISRVLLSLGNLVWKDLNNDGIANTDEPRLANIELILFKDGGDGVKESTDDIQIGKDTTDTNGHYLFENLSAGEYFVKINELPMGMVSSTGEGISSTSNSGPYEPAPDADSDINNTDDGTYMNGMIMSSLVTLELDNEPTNDGDMENSSNLSIDFGLYQILALGNLVWHDIDNDGIKDTDEDGFPNIEVVLYQLGLDGQKGTEDDIEIAKDTTDTNGDYLFDYLNEGDYFVKLNNIPTGFVSSTGEGFIEADGTGAYEPAADPDNNINGDDDGSNMLMPDGSLMVMSQVISLTFSEEPTDDGDTNSSTNYSVDFGLFETLELGNLVWEDLDNDGIAEIGEPGFENIEVVLCKAGLDGQKGTEDDIEIGRDTTDSSGHYLFTNLYPGKYFVKLNSGIPIHYCSSTGEGMTLADGTGAYEPASDPDANINNDDDGTQMGAPDGNLVIMSDLVTMQLYDEPINDGDTDNTTNYDIDFGIIPLLAIGNMVWEDLNNNGLMDSGEPGIEGIETILYKDGGDGQVNTADDIEIGRITTDAEGKYLYKDLYPGDYFVKLNDGIPYNMFSSTGEGIELITGKGPFETAPDQDIVNSNVDDNGTQMDKMIISDLVTLVLYDEPTNDDDANNNTNTAVDFGLIRKLDLGGEIWLDRDNDGIIDKEEENIKGMEVILFQPGADGQVGTVDDIEIQRDTTDGFGQYVFDCLFPDAY